VAASEGRWADFIIFGVKNMIALMPASYQQLQDRTHAAQIVTRRESCGTGELLGYGEHKGYHQ
jgi:hypothetical protein